MQPTQSFFVFNNRILLSIKQHDEFYFNVKFFDVQKSKRGIAFDIHVHKSDKTKNLFRLNNICPKNPPFLTEHYDVSKEKLVKTVLSSFVFVTC